MLQKAELLITGGEGEIVAARQTAALLGAERWIGEDQGGWRQPLAIAAKGVAIPDAVVPRTGIQSVQHEVHQRQPVRVLHVLHAIEGALVVLLLLRRIQLADLLVVTNPTLCRYQEPACAGGRILDHIPQPRLHHRHHGIDQRPGGEVLACPGFLLLGVLLQQPLIQIAQAFLAGAVPIDLVDLVNQLFERDGFFNEGTGVGVDLSDDGRGRACFVSFFFRFFFVRPFVGLG